MEEAGSAKTAARITRRHLLAAATLAPLWPARAVARCVTDPLGTSRTLRVGTEGGLFTGLKTYPRALPLAPREVILSFDDGPAATTPAILEALACEEVKATFFMIGRNVAGNPALARRVRDQGHTVASHSWSHPWTFRNLSVEAGRADIEKGFAILNEAVFNLAATAPPPVPFFRFPGFADTAPLDAWLASRKIGVFGCDLWASDWDPMAPERQLSLVMERLEKAGRGHILFHDTRAQTAAMLPAFLRALKRRDYKIVHMVPGPGTCQTIAAPAGWKSETEAIIAGKRG
jgi:peptidoglycan/xylan/chitin deacetylase (PgdA/CDA1 family)